MSDNGMMNESRMAIDLLKESRLLKNLPQDFLLQLAPHLKIKRFSPNDEIVKKSSSGTEVHFLIRGKIAIYSKGSLMFKLRRLGDMVGDMSFITDRQMTTTKVADTSVELLSLNISDVINQPDASSEEIKWIIYQLFTAMLIDMLSICCTKTAEEQADFEQLDRLKELLAETRVKLDSVTKVKQNFLANINHEMRTPMHGVLGMTSLLLNTDLTDQQRDFALTIKRSASAYLDVINSILDFSNLSRGELELNSQPFEINNLIGKVYNELQPKAIDKELDIKILIDSAVPKLVIGDSVRIHQILINLAGNAIKFTEKGKVEISVSVLSSFENLVRLKFSINDSGIGISEDERNLLFQSFSQADTSLSRKYDGAGLGLAISKQLIEAMSGEIDFESEKGVGSVFWFTLDFKIQEDRRNHAVRSLPYYRKPTRESDLLPPVTIRNNKHSKILLVCSDKIDQFISVLMLERLGFSPEVADSGEKAIANLQKDDFDIVLLDSSISDMHVFELTNRIRSGKDGIIEPDVPIIGLKTHMMECNRAKYLPEGMSDCLAKPIAIETLDTAIQRWISFKDRAVLTPEIEDFEQSQCVDPQMIERLRKDVGEIEILIELYLKELPGKVEAIKKAIIDQKAPELEKWAHTLKSNCITFGAITMADICYKLEKIGNSGVIFKADKLIKMLENQKELVSSYFNRYYLAEIQKPLD